MVKVIPTDLLDSAMFYRVPGIEIRVYIQPNYNWDEVPYVQEVDDSHEEVVEWLDSLVDEGLITLDRTAKSAEDLTKELMIPIAIRSGLEWTKAYVKQTKIGRLRAELLEAIRALRRLERKKAVSY